MKAVRPHYKQSWPPIVHAISLWLTSTAFVSEEAATVGASESYSVAFCSWSIWDKVFNNGQSKICGRQPLKNLSCMVCLGRRYHFKFFKGCLPQILLSSFLNTLSHMVLNYGS